MQTMERTAPVKTGIHSHSIIRFLNELELRGMELHSLLISAHGKLIFEGYWAPYRPDIPHILHSLTKVYTNTAVGFAAAEGLLRLDDTVLSFFPEYAGLLDDPRQKRMTVRDLITMRSGHGRMISGNEWRPIRTSWIKEFFKEPLVWEPGEKYQYSSGNSYMLSAIVQKASGQTACDYLQSRFFEPLGLKNVQWDLSPEGINPGGNGLSLCTMDILKTAQFYLQKGCWGGRQILPAEWIERSLGRRDAPTDGQPLYGYHWNNFGNGRAYIAGGAFGQAAVLIPELDMAMAVTAGHNKDTLFEVMEHTLLEKPGEVSPEEDTILKNKGDCLNLLVRVEPTESPILPPGAKRVYSCGENEDSITEIALSQEQNVLRFTMADHRGRHTVLCGMGGWISSSTSMTGNYLHHQYQPEHALVCASGWWEKPDRLTLIWRYPEMAFCDRVTLRFSENGETLSMLREVNVNSQGLKRPEVTGICLR